MHSRSLSSHWPISISYGAAALFNLFLPLVLVRYISPDEVGRYKVFFLYVTVAPGLLLTGGFANGLYHWAGRYPESRPEIRQGWTILWGITLILCSLGLLLLSPLASALKAPRMDLSVLLLYCPLGIACAYLEDLLIARGDIWKGAVYGSTFQVLRSALCLAAAFFGRKVEYVLWAFFGATVLRLISGYLIVHRSGDITPLFSRAWAKEVLKYSFPVSIAGLAGVALGNVDQLILSFRLNPADFAFYSLGCLAIPPLQILEISVNRVAIPKLSKAIGAKDYSTAAHLYSETVSELYRFLLPAAAGLILFAHPIIRILFTERYAAAARFLQVYAIYYVLMSIPFNAVARAAGDSRWILRLSTVFALLSIVATAVSTVVWGAMGALIAFLSVQLAYRVYSLVYQKRLFHLPYSEFMPVKSMTELTGWVAVLSGLAFASRGFFADERVWFIAAGGLFTLLYFAGAYFILKRPEDDATLTETAKGFETRTANL